MNVNYVHCCHNCNYKYPIGVYGFFFAMNEFGDDKTSGPGARFQDQV